MYYRVLPQTITDPPTFEIVQRSLVKNGWREKRVIRNLSGKKANAICTILNSKDNEL